MKRKWIFYLLIIAFVWVLVSHFAEVRKLTLALSQGQWQWILAAVLVQVVFYCFYAGVYRAAFHVVDVKVRLVDLIPLVFAHLFMNLVAPSGGASGASLFVDYATSRKQSAARTTAGLVLVNVADFGTFTLVLLVGIVYLFIQHDLKAYEIVGILGLLLIIGGLSGVLVLGVVRPIWLERLMHWLAQAVAKVFSWFKRPTPLPVDWAETNAAEFNEAATAIRAHPGRVALTLAIALSAHMVDILSLFVLFIAYRQPVTFGMLVAGFSMGVLFWIVSITPQGIGVVEGVMALVFTSLGANAQIATSIALAFRGLTFWLPVLIGFFVLRRVNTFSSRGEAISNLWGVRLVAFFTALMGVINLISAVTPALANRLVLLRQFSPLDVRRGTHLTAALAGFALILLAGSLWRRKRVAWLVTLVILVISAISHVYKGLNVEEAALALGLALWLFVLRREFHARSDEPTIRRGLVVLAVALVFTLAYGTLGFYLLDRHFSLRFSLLAAMQQTVVMFTSFYDPGLQAITGFGRYFADSIYVVSVVTLGFAGISLVSPVLVRHPASPTEKARARAIVEQYGCSSLARAALFADKTYFFTPGGSVIAYTVKGRIALVLGDPIGPPTDLEPALNAFALFCQQNDWQAVYYQTEEDTQEAYRAVNLRSLCIGREAIVDLPGFTLQGSAMKPIRNSFNKLVRLGFTAHVVEPPLTDELLRTLRDVSAEWLSEQHTGESRFSLGWFDDDYIRNSRVVVITDPQGVVCAFANLVGEYQRNEMTLDLMRHRARLENGTMDFLFASMLNWAQQQGYETFNLGLSGLSGVGEHSDDTAVERALHYIYKNVNQFYDFKGLHAFKLKFQPRWSPRYLMFPGMSSLPTVAFAMVRANSGDDFVLTYLRR